MLEYRALGGLSVVDGGAELRVGGPRQRRLAAVLLIHRNQVVSIDRLGEVVFAGEPTPQAATTLRSYVARLRRVVEHPESGSRVVTRAPGYLLEVDDEAFDVARFERSVAAGRACLADGDSERASHVLRAGLGLWRGEAYAEFSGEEWGRAEAQRLAELRLVAYELTMDADLQRGRAAEVASELESLVAAHPLRESFQAKLMLALYRSGRQAEALRAYQAHRSVLAEELGIDPTPDLAELEGRILVHDAGLRDVEPGEVRLRGYRLGERLGTGRDGTVYAARLPGVDRDMVMRVVPEAVADEPGFVRSFDADARRAAALGHPAVVPLYDWWREPGAAYVVMRRMRGGTLRDRLQRGPLPAAEVGALATRIGGALVAADEAGVRHGRVAAEGILFDEAGDAYLADLPLGTCDGRAPGDDVGDLAAVVAEALTGQGEAGGSNGAVPAAVADILHGPPSNGDRPPLASFVPALVAALSGQAGAPAHPRPNPYKGLRAFDEPDAEDFFGRDGLVDQIVARLAGDGPEARLVLVVGGSGSGKSSLVRAGLLPRVRQGAVGGSDLWYVTPMVPGESPFKELAESLRRVSVDDADWAAGELAGELAAGERGIDRVVRRIVPDGGELLLVVDQLEELFTLADDSAQRGFLDGLTYALAAEDSRLRVVATLRADFYDRPLRFERFGSAVGETTVPIAAMSAAELEAAIAGPAERVGARVEPALVAELVGAVLHEPAALPSLQFTLYELAERSPDGVLTLAGYRELGGVDGAIAARAEDLYRSLDDAARSSVRHLFERLVVVSSDAEPTRRRALRSEVADAAGSSAGDVLDIVEAWAQARLLTLDRHADSRAPTVEVAHEALLREWPRLRSWLDEDREAIVALGQLREAAAGWADLDRDPGALYRGARLDAAVQLADRGDRALAPPEAEFLEASRAARDRERKRAADEMARTARANRRLRVQLVALGVALVVALVVGAVAVGQRNRAEQEETVATARELAAAANANLDVDPERSILLALAAVDEARSGGGALAEAEQALHDAVTASRIAQRIPGVGGAVAWSPDGTRLAAAGSDGAVDVLDARSGDAVRSIAGHDAAVNGIAFSPDGALLGTTSEDGFAKLWDLRTGEELAAFDSPLGRDALAPSFSPDGRLFAAAWWNEGFVRLVDVGTGRVVREIGGLANPRSTAFDPRGTRMAVAGETGESVVVDVATGDVVVRIGDSDATAAWSPDGASIATAGADGIAAVFDSATGRLRFELHGHRDRIDAVDWRPDGRALVTAGADGTARVWSVGPAGGRELFTLSAQDTRAGIADVAFSPDGARIATGDVERRAVLTWDAGVAGDAEVATLPARGATGEGSTHDFTPDGRYLVAGNAEGGVTVWDAQTFAVARVLGGSSSSGTPPADGAIGSPSAETPFEVNALAVSPDGRLVAAAIADRSQYPGVTALRVWDVETGQEAMRVTPRGYVDDVAWSPDGDRLAISAGVVTLEPFHAQSAVTIVERSGREVAYLPDEQDFVQIRSLAFTDDGRGLIGARSETRSFAPVFGQVAVWDGESGDIQRTVDTGGYRAVLSPDGDLLVTTPPGFLTGSPVAEVWDWETGRHLRSLTGHSGSVIQAAFSPDGARLATTTRDGTIRLWDAHTGDQQLELRGHQGEVGSVAFSPDGSRLASMSVDGTVRVWAVDLDGLVEVARGEVTRTLTDDECGRYLHTERCPLS